MLLKVRNRDDKSRQRTGHNSFRYAGFTLFLLIATFLTVSGQSSAQAPTIQNPPASVAPQNTNPQTPNTAFSDSPRPRPGLNIVVLDPAHGGTDTGARGTGGIRESEIVLQFALQVRRALESQGFQVIQTRMANENPSFDDRSAMANAQVGAVFVSLHVSSTGLPGTVRVYVNSDLPPTSGGREASGLIPWDRAQAPFLFLSRKLGDFVQGNLAVRFRGSPASSQAAAIRQLRTTAAPAIAVEISSVAVNDRLDLDRMAPGVADAIARGVTDFRPSYVVAGIPGGLR
jgi:N-acetylmuramoyl-L-alanine amidase